MGFYRKEIKMEEKTVTEPDKELSTPMEVAQKMTMKERVYRMNVRLYDGMSH